MKTKLRKEFEEFKSKTNKRLWLLENPPRFKNGDKVLVFNTASAIYRQESKIIEIKGGYFCRYCLVDMGTHIAEQREIDLYKA